MISSNLMDRTYKSILLGQEEVAIVVLIIPNRSFCIIIVEWVASNYWNRQIVL